MKKAFTLTEILISILIIGIIASLTIPSVVKNYQEREMASRYKKFYSDFSKLFTKSNQDFGSAKNWTFSSCEDGFNKYYKPYFKIKKKCKDYAVGGKECGRYNGVFSITQPIYILEDGTFISIFGYSTKNNGDCAGKHTVACGSLTLHFDLNGDRPPNKSGVDIHSFQYIVGNKTFSQSNAGKELLKK